MTVSSTAQASPIRCRSAPCGMALPDAVHFSQMTMTSRERWRGCVDMACHLLHIGRLPNHRLPAFGGCHQQGTIAGNGLLLVTCARIRSDIGMQRLLGKYPRYGCAASRCFWREGTEVGKEQCSRLWTVQTFQHRRSGRAADSVWNNDFVSDACANGQPLRCLTVFDACAGR